MNELDNKGFIQGKIEFKSIPTEVDIEDGQGLDWLDLNNINFTFEIENITYNEFTTIYQDDREYGTVVLKCPHPKEDNTDIVIKFLMTELNYNIKDTKPKIINDPIMNDIKFYQEYGFKLGNITTNIIDRPFYIIIWESKVYKELIVGYKMKYVGPTLDKYENVITTYKYYNPYSDEILFPRITYYNPSFISEIILKTKQIINNINKLHEKGIYHLDLKPDNISTNGQLIDFDSASTIINFESMLNNLYLGNNQYLMLGTPGYQAPEIITMQNYYPGKPTKEQYNEIWEKMDVFSLGCCLCYILFNDISFYQESINNYYPNVRSILAFQYFITSNQIDTPRLYKLYFGDNGHIHRLLYQLKKNMVTKKKYIDLVSQMVRLNPDERISIKTLCQEIELID